MTSSALVTGGAGFIGSSLVRGLLKRGKNVHVLDNFSSGSKANLEGLDIEIIEADVRDAKKIGQAIKEVDQIYHLAAMVSVSESVRDPIKCYSVNLEGSLNVLNTAQSSQIDKVVLISSCAIYGRKQGSLTETDPAHPGSPYAASKLAMEQAATLYADLYDLDIVSLRLFNVYGPGQSAETDYAAVIPAFLQAYLSSQPPVIDGTGEQTRDFVFIDDVVDAILAAGDSRRGGGEVLLNVGSGRSVSILQLTREIKSLLESELEPTFGSPRPGDVTFSKADIGRIEKSLGYRPKVSLAEGLDRTVEWLRSTQEFQSS